MAYIYNTIYTRRLSPPSNGTFSFLRLSPVNLVYLYQLRLKPNVSHFARYPIATGRFRDYSWLTLWPAAKRLSARCSPTVLLHTTKLNNQCVRLLSGYHFDTFKFVERLETEGFTREQSEAIMASLREVITER